MAKAMDNAAAFALPTYETKRRARMGALSVAIPDGMVVPKTEGEFALLAYSKGFKGGVAQYKDAPLSINCKTAAVQQAASLAALWNGNAKERKAAFCGILERRLESMERRYAVKYQTLANGLDAVYAQIDESEKGEEPWCGYLVLFFHADTLYQVQIYINAKRDKKAFLNAVKEWVSLATVAAKKATAKKPAEKKPAAKKPAAKKPDAKKPAAKKPTVKKAVVKQPIEAPKTAWLPRGTASYRSRWVRK